MSTLTDLIDDMPCTYCGANRRKPCKTRSGKVAVTTHTDRYLLGVAVYRKLGHAWTKGHTACSHSCTTYAGLGEECQNPYAWTRTLAKSEGER